MPSLADPMSHTIAKDEELSRRGIARHRPWSYAPASEARRTRFGSKIIIN